MEIDDNNLVNKLIILFIFDKMGMPVTEKTLLEMCASRNNWVNYMESIECLGELVDSGFVFRATSERSEYYTITTSGRECLDSFFTRIPASKRTEIADYIKETGNHVLYRVTPVFLGKELGGGSREIYPESGDIEPRLVFEMEYLESLPEYVQINLNIFHTYRDTLLGRVFKNK